MPWFNVQVTQVFKATRIITVLIDAEDRESAIEQISSEGAPDFDHLAWHTVWDLEDEQVTVLS